MLFLEVFGGKPCHILECTAIQLSQKRLLKITPSLIRILEGGRRPHERCPIKGGRDAFCLWGGRSGDVADKLQDGLPYFHVFDVFGFISDECGKRRERREVEISRLHSSVY